MTIKRTIKLPKTIREGWGLTSHIDVEYGISVQNLYVSDGTSRIYVCDPENLQVKRFIVVKDEKNKLLAGLNELEFIKGFLWANIFLDDRVAIINPNTGKVEKFLDFKLLMDRIKKIYGNSYDNNYCLNGIAYDEDNDR